MTELAGRRAAKAQEVDQRILALQEQVLAAEERLRRLYCLVEDGNTDGDDLLHHRLSTLRAERSAAQAALERSQAANRPPTQLDTGVIARFGHMMRDKLTTGEIPFRKAHLAAIVDRIEVDERQIRIVGRKDVLERAVTPGETPTTGVHSFVRGWRSRQDSNLRPSA